VRRVSYEGVKLAHCISGAFEGTHVGAAQVTVAVHEGAAFDMDWRGPDSDRLRSSTVPRGGIHVGDGRLPFWVRCTASPTFFAFGIEESLMKDIWEKAFGGPGDCFIGSAIDVDDPIAKHFCDLGRLELDRGGASGRLYAEGMATALGVHLLRKYGTGKQPPAPHRGGIAPIRLRRVLEFIAAHLQDDLSLADLSAVAGLSSHHFGAAFKASIGTPPYRYVMERRVQVARELLRDGKRSVAEIAYAAGFASQAHLTTSFRRVTGTTPGRFRRSLS
jgi:AraC family transcriptional regulator